MHTAAAHMHPAATHVHAASAHVHPTAAHVHSAHMSAAAKMPTAAAEVAAATAVTTSTAVAAPAPMRQGWNRSADDNRSDQRHTDSHYLPGHDYVSLSPAAEKDASPRSASIPARIVHLEWAMHGCRICHQSGRSGK
jgi:hypothetical protein